MVKKLSNDDKIIATLDAIDKSVKTLNKFSAGYDAHIDKAALRGDDKRARQLIKQKIGVNELADQLEMLKSNISLGASTAKVMSALQTLPAAIAGCKGLLSESPDFSKLGKDINRIFKDMQKPVEDISKLNDILDNVLSPKEESTLESRLGGISAAEETDQFKTEYAAMMERLKMKVASAETIEKPIAETDTATEDIDYMGLIDKENKRK